jgi:hypothetical protein
MTMLDKVKQEESGIATFEFAVTVILLMATLLGLLAALDAAYMRTVTEHVASALGRQAVFKPGDSWDNLIEAGREMMAANHGVQRASAACIELCNKECDGNCKDPSPATCIIIHEVPIINPPDGLPPITNLFNAINATVEVSVTHYTSIPIISQNQLFPKGMQCIKMGATYYVNKWNAAIFFNTPQQ